MAQKRKSAAKGRHDRNDSLPAKSDEAVRGPSEMDIVRAFTRQRNLLAGETHRSALTRNVPYNLCSC